MLTLAILGILYGEPLHGYELKSRIAALTGHARALSDGALYPAIGRMEKAGLLLRHTEPGSGAAPRQTLELTERGRVELLRRLADPEQAEIADQSRFFTLAAFLHHLADPRRQAAVLRRRLAFLEAPGRSFRGGVGGGRGVGGGGGVGGGRGVGGSGGSGLPVGAEGEPNPFRRGPLLVARAAGAAERSWLTDTIRELEHQGA